MSIQLNLGIHPKDYCRFQNYYISEENRQTAYRLRDMGSAEEPEHLFLCGASGSGVSHLLQATCHSFHRSGRDSIYLPVQMFKGRETELFQSFIDVKPVTRQLFVVDDIQLLEKNVDAQVVFFHLYNQLVAEGVFVVLGGNRAPMQLTLDLADLQSRFCAMLVCPLHSLNDNEKKIALRERAEMRGFSLSEDMLNYLLKRGSRNMGDLMHCLDRLDNVSMQKQQKISLSLMRNVLAEIEQGKVCD